MPVPTSLADQLAACSADLEALVAPLDEAGGRWRPGPNRWSVAECLAHLAATARQYQPGLDRAAARVRARGRAATGSRGPGAFRPGWVGRRIVGAMEPGAGVRLSAPGALVPPSDVTLADAVGAFEETQTRLRDTIASVAGLDLGSATLPSPVFPLMRLSLGTALALLAAHERRHLAQARRVITAPGFPGREFRGREFPGPGSPSA